MVTINMQKENPLIGNGYNQYAKRKPLIYFARLKFVSEFSIFPSFPGKRFIRIYSEADTTINHF